MEPTASRSICNSSDSMKSMALLLWVGGHEPGGDGNRSAPKVLAQALGLRIGPGGRGHPFPQQAHHHEVEGAQVGERVALHLEVVGLGQQDPELPDGEEASSHAHGPTLALPPLSPDRAPMMVPRCRCRVGPAAMAAVAVAAAASGPVPARRAVPASRTMSGATVAPGASDASAAESTTDGSVAARWAVWGTSTRRPSAWTTEGTTE